MARIRALVVDDDSRLVDSMQTRIGRVTATDVGEGQRLINSSAAKKKAIAAIGHTLLEIAHQALKRHALPGAGRGLKVQDRYRQANPPS